MTLTEFQEGPLPRPFTLITRGYAKSNSLVLPRTRTNVAGRPKSSRTIRVLERFEAASGSRRRRLDWGAQAYVGAREFLVRSMAPIASNPRTRWRLDLERDLLDGPSRHRLFRAMAPRAVDFPVNSPVRDKSRSSDLGEVRRSSPMSQPALSFPRFLRLSEVAEITGASAKTVESWCSAGKLPSRMIGGRRAVTEADLRAFVGEPPVGSAAEPMLSAAPPARVNHNTLAKPQRRPRARSPYRPKIAPTELDRAAARRALLDAGLVRTKETR